MAAELVNAATSEKLTEVDWTKSIEICEFVAHDQRQAKDVIKAIKRRLGSKNSNTQMFTLMLLEMLMNNIGGHVHRQVIDTGLLPMLVKIVKKKSDSPAREKIFLLLDATQTSLGGNSGRFPQYYSAYYDLVSAGVKFPQRAHAIPPNHQPNSVANTDVPPAVEQPSATSRQRSPAEVEPHTIPESSIIQKAGSALEVLREVLDAVDSQHPEGAKEEFTLDLVEQCSFQKQRVMHLVLTSRDEKVVSQAIDLNDQLEKVLNRHDQLISGKATSKSNHFVHDKLEEEDEQLFRRIRKGKGHAQAEDEDREKPMHRPITRDSPSQQRPLVIGPPLKSAGVKFPQRAQAIPPNHQPTSVVNTYAQPVGEQPPSTLRQHSPTEVEPHTVPESSIIQKAASVLEVLREVLDAVDSQHPEGAKEEFTLDLVEQCSFQKQRVMHLVLTSRDETVVSQAVDLNDQLEKVLNRHDQLISGRTTSTSNHFVHDEVEVEEEQLFRRIRKGKGHARAEDEDREKLIHRPITREQPGQQRPLVIGPPLKVGPLQPPQANGSGAGSGVAIPPPPAKYVEREKFFQENIIKSDSTGLATHVRGLSLHSRRSSGNSYSLSTDSD